MRCDGVGSELERAMTDAELIANLRENALIKEGRAWQRLDGGQDLSIGAALANKAADRLEALSSTPAQDDARAKAMGEAVETAKDHVALWQNQKISGASRAERNAALEDSRARLIRALAALEGKEG